MTLHERRADAPAPADAFVAARTDPRLASGPAIARFMRDKDPIDAHGSSIVGPPGPRHGGPPAGCAR